MNNLQEKYDAMVVELERLTEIQDNNLKVSHQTIVHPNEKE